MSRADTQLSSAVGHDSFLDVVTNMVGILIVLVMVVGMRIKNAPVQFTPNTQMLEAHAAVEKDRAAESSLHREVMETARQIENLAGQAVLRSRERDLLATMAAASEHEIRSQREALDAGAKADFDAARDLAESRRRLDRLKQAENAARHSAPEPEVIRNYPTPLAKMAVGDEAHFQLRGGRLAHVPVEKLLLLARSDAKAKADKLFGEKRLPEFTETVGPEGGFRFRYTATREDKTERTPNGLARVAYLAITRWTVIPVSDELGEPVEAALSPSSEFRKILGSLRPGDVTVTIWVYQESFESFRRIRGELYRLGFPTAARPLPDGVVIGGSPKGTKSETE